MPKMQNVHLKCWNDKSHCQVSVIGLKSLDVSPCNELLFNFIHRKNFDSSINKEKIQKQKNTHNQHFSVNKDLYMAAEDKYNKEQTEI